MTGRWKALLGRVRCPAPALTVAVALTVDEEFVGLTVRREVAPVQAGELAGPHAGGRGGPQGGVYSVTVHVPRTRRGVGGEREVGRR